MAAGASTRSSKAAKTTSWIALLMTFPFSMGPSLLFGPMRASTGEQSPRFSQDVPESPWEIGFGSWRSALPVSVGGGIYGSRMSDFPVDVIRSRKRTRTAQATLREGRIRVMVPSGLDPEEEERVVSELTKKISSKARSSQIDLTTRSKQLARKYRLPAPTSIEWSTRQMQRWGSCTPEKGRIRISSRLAAMPPWVLDSVIVHELAHLEVPGHGADFHELVNRYELTERAKGYLIAMSEGSAA